MTFQDLELKRDAYQKRVHLINLIFLPILLAIILFYICFGVVGVLFSTKPTSFPDIFVFLFGLIPLFQAGIFLLIAYLVTRALATRKLSRAYREAYKEYFVRSSLEKTFSHLSYTPNEGLPRAVISGIGMMQMGNRYFSNDLAFGKYKDVAFSQADVRIENETTDSDGDTSTVILFRGKWLVFEFGRDFTANLQVVERGFHNYSHNSFSGNGKHHKKLEVESTTFNKKFKIFAQDGFEAFYILDPTFIEAIEWLGDNITGEIMLCFIDKKLHIALANNQDSFEPCSYKTPIDESKELEKVSSEIKVITTFVDKLKLDKKLFKN